LLSCVFFFFQAEDGIRDFHVTGVQTCALPISFAIAGSIIIFLLGLEMILGMEFFKPDGGNGKTGSIVPIAFPLIAGSGTLTTILSLKATYNQYAVLLGILINLVFIFICIRSLNLME